MIRNCSIIGTTGSRGPDNRFWNCYFEATRRGDSEPFSAHHGGNGTEVIRCRQVGGTLRSSRPTVGCIYTENVVRGGSGGVAGMMTYDGQNNRWSYNVIYGCDRGLFIYRTAHDEVYNNIFHKCRTAIFGGAPGTNELICNNVFADSGGIALTPDSRGVVATYNSFFKIRGDRLGIMRWSSHYPKPFTEQQKADFRKLIYQDSQRNIEADPAFTDPAQHDYRPSQETALVDAGDPSFPVPVGGGDRVDIGRYEFGAKFPYTDWQPKFKVTDPSPTITWTFEDWDKEDVQGAFQVQIDASCYFDTENLIDSGKTAGNASAWRVPRTLKPGKYYFRIRAADDKQPDIFGLWSDRHYCFEVIEKGGRKHGQP